MGTQGRGILIVFIIALIIPTLASCGNRRAPQGVSPGAVMPVTRTLPPLPSRPLSPKLTAMRERAMRVSSALRELEWKSEVGMTELSGFEYGTRANEMTQALGGEELRAFGRLATAGGALPEGTDLAQLGASFIAISASATYSPLDKQILLVEPARDDSLLTHEFVHALQDQHFDLMRLLVVRPFNYDRTEAAFALIEGDAMNVQRRSEEGEAYNRRSLDEITRQESERFGGYRAEAGKWFPPLLVETFIFRYRDGARFVESVRRRGGERAVDELFRNPPASSEQVIHPEKYFAGEAPREILLDEAGFLRGGWRATTSTPVGEIGLRGLLMAGMTEAQAVRAAAGWGGDRAYLFERAGGAPLFAWKTTWDTRKDAEEFFSAYNALQRSKRSRADGSKTFVGEDETQAGWIDRSQLTLLRRVGESVLILRGTEADVKAALEIARG